MKRKHKTNTLSLAAVLSFCMAIGAGKLEAQQFQAQASETAETAKSSPASLLAPVADVFKGLKYRNIGPNRGGRSTAAAGTAARKNE